MPKNLKEIDKKTLHSYRDKAQKSLKKSGKYFDTGSGITNNPKTAAKHKKTIDKRTKGLGSVIKRAGVSSGPQKYITKPSNTSVDKTKEFGMIHMSILVP